MGQQSEGWSEDTVLDVVLDMRTTGVGGFPRIVEDEEWVEANAKMIAELGPEAYLRRLLALTGDSVGDAPARAVLSEVLVEAEGEEIQEADAIAVAQCDDCGGGVVVFFNEQNEVFAQAHLPVEPDDWLDSDFIPALRKAAKFPRRNTTTH